MAKQVGTEVKGHRAEPVTVEKVQSAGSDTLKPSQADSDPDTLKPSQIDSELNAFELAIESELKVTEEDLADAKAHASSMSLETLKKLMINVLKLHEHDPNFPHSILVRIHQLLDNPAVLEEPEKHSQLIWEMKLEASLITNNSPYSEVRAVVDNTDDVTMPSSTIRSWTLGCFFSVVLAFVNQLFSIRQPPIFVDSNVAQLLAYPCGKAWERWMPDWRFRLWGTEHRLNPGHFSKKEHMLIAIMATTAKSLPYTNYIVWTQVLPSYFNQSYARSFAYQLLVGLSTNFLGYGLAGLTRRFLVYPSYCVWPRSLVTIALNSALHDEKSSAVPGPFGRVFTVSRYRFFMWAFGVMFVYFWFPNWLFGALTFFSWMTWIKPHSLNLNILTGMQNGMGLLNPWPTFDWNVLLFQGIDPLMVPAFSTFNWVGGAFLWGWIIVAIYYSNTWNTGYLPINTNKLYNHFGKRYNVSMALDERGMYNHEKYMNYSAAYLGAANVIVYLCFFAVYASTITYCALFHRAEISMGFKNMWRSIRWRKKKESDVDEGEYQDVHYRFMQAYPEVSEYWYFGTLALAAACGFAGVAGWPTYTTVAVVPYGILLAIIFVIPIGIITSITGIEVTLNVLAEFIGGIWVQGNALAMNYFKAFGYVTCAHAIAFANDLKLAHYLKIPPRHTFAAQMVATLISTVICTAVIQIQLDIRDVCTPEAPMRFTCPGPATFFTASVLWGTIGPLKTFSIDGQYGATQLGWLIGFAAPFLYWLLVRRFPASRWIRQIHPVAIFTGPLSFSPYSFSYMWPAAPIAWLSWIFVKNRWLGFWSKYNFVLSAALSAGIAISGTIMLFSVQWAQIELDWWGNTQPNAGCEGTPCTLKTLAEGERFYPWWDGNKVAAP